MRPVVHRIDRGRPHPLPAQCAPTIKKLSLELGGNAPFIVFDDADIDSAVEGAMPASTATPARPASAPTACIAGRRVRRNSSRSSPPKASAIKVGSGFEAGVNQGPLIDDQATAKVKRHVADAVAKGADRRRRHADRRTLRHTPTSAGRRHSRHAVRARGDLRPGGAGVPLQDRGRGDRRRQRHRVLASACYFYSRDIGRIFRVGEALEYGMVGVNTGLISTAEVPLSAGQAVGPGPRGLTTASRTTSRSNTSAWATS